MSQQQASTHCAEPEIIPPSARVRLHDSDAMWVSLNERGTHHIYVTRLGPFSLVLLTRISLLAALVLVLAISTFLIWIFLVALLVAATIIFALLRQWFRRWH